ncbi:MAG: hypothetical protein ABJC66_14490 [Gammaproteobacteria bacterium]
MRQAHYSMLLGVWVVVVLAGCGSSSYSSSRGTDNGSGTSGPTTTGGNPPANPIGGTRGPTGSNNGVVATPSAVGIVTVAVGATRTVSITFTSNDGNAISGFGTSGTLAGLPAGWSGPAGFSCAAVSAGSGCILNLTYAPTAVAAGTFTVDYVFVDNSSMPSTGGSLSIAYAATAHDNIVAVASPSGEINAVVGGSNRSVSVNFITDDGNAATDLTLTTDLTGVPGWSMPAAGPCAIVSTGSGCQLLLTFAPAAAARGILTLNYSYIDSSGTARSGGLNIPYSTTSHDSVVASAAPAGEINAALNSAGQAVAVSFTTDDGKPAADLYLTSSLTVLPAGWSSATNGFSCASVGSGNGCQLHLTYAPLILAGGTLVLNYAFTDPAGVAKTGSLNVVYTATTNDNSVATAAPTGQINAVVGLGTQSVSVTFTTDDGRAATALQLTSSLATLPAGWSSTASSFSCSGFGSGSACQLPLAYAPAAAGNGTLMLSYSYANNAGESKTGAVNIAYQATTDDNIVATPNPGSLAVSAGSSTPVTVTFTTDDSNPAGNLSVTSALGSLPSGWSSTATAFTCSMVSTGSTCVLNLTYAPLATGSGTLSLTYRYDDDSGTAKTGSVSIPFTATP